MLWGIQWTKFSYLEDVNCPDNVAFLFHTSAGLVLNILKCCDTFKSLIVILCGITIFLIYIELRYRSSFDTVDIFDTIDLLIPLISSIPFIFWYRWYLRYHWSFDTVDIFDTVHLLIPLISPIPWSFDTVDIWANPNVRMSSFSWKNCMFASTSWKQLVNTWTAQDRMTCGQNRVCMQQTPLRPCWTANLLPWCEGHQLAHEALWHIKWQIFETWLSEYGHEDEVNVIQKADYLM